MSEQKIIFENAEQAEVYVDEVRHHYRQEHGAYAGRRNEDQRLIAEVTAEEARQVVDGTLMGLLALNGSRTNISLENYDDVEVAGHTWAEYRGEFERLLVGF